MMADSDVQRVLEMLHGLRTDVAVIRETVGKLDHAVNGNGKPGLTDRMTIIEERQSSCPARKSYSDGARNNRIGGYALVVAAVLAVLEIFDRFGK